ncbi:hypothetical protein AB1Y20_011545 [Prymnesium parvum]|uniref:Uncharacterized protein n=1 Tax=Prymnesium parvum TaxID=97485 RepID=A0AB34IG87_PRYPA
MRPLAPSTQAFGKILFYGGPEEIVPKPSPPQDERSLPRNKQTQIRFGNPEDVVPQPSSPTKFSELHTRSQIVIGGPEQFTHEALRQQVAASQQARHAGRTAQESLLLSDEAPPLPLPLRAHAGKTSASTVALTDELPQGAGGPPPHGYYFAADGRLRRVPLATGGHAHLTMAGVCADAPTHDATTAHRHHADAAASTTQRLFGDGAAPAAPRRRTVAPPAAQLEGQQIQGFSPTRQPAPPHAPPSPRAASPPPAAAEEAALTWRHAQLQGLPALAPSAAAPSGGEGRAPLLYDAERRQWVTGGGEPAGYDPVLQRGAPPPPPRFAPAGERARHPLWTSSHEHAFGRKPPPPPTLDVPPFVQEKARISHSFSRGFAPPRSNLGFNV